MKTTKRLLSLLLALVTLCSVIAIPAFAASTWPSLSSSGYCEMISPGKISVYRDSSLKTPGTSNPARSYSAYVAKNDKIYILKVTESYTQLSYPTSSGRRIGFVKTSTLFGVTSPTEVITSKAKVTTYTGASTSSKSGNTAVGDTVFKLGTTKGGYVLIMYTAVSGSRSMKAAFITKSDYEKVKGNSTSTSVTSSGWQWPMSGYWVTQSFNNKTSSSSRPYHCGIDIKSNNTNVYAAATGTVVYKGYSSGNGYHVVLSHNLNGTTVKTLYSHLSNYNSCPAVGQTVSKGTQIGVMGSTGNSTGPHLHFAIYTGSSNNPYGYASSSGSNKISYGGCVFYNPYYVISNGRLP